MTTKLLVAFVVAAASATLVLPDAASAAVTKLEKSSGAVTTYTQVSDDGCVVTSGEIAVIDDAFGDGNPRGVYVTAVQQDVCDPTDNGRGFAGFTTVGDYEVLGTSLAWASATVVAKEYSGSGAAPLTFELDLQWKGKGSVSVERTQTNEGGVQTLLTHVTRAAKMGGTLTIDGEAAVAGVEATIANDTRVTVTH